MKKDKWLIGARKIHEKHRKSEEHAGQPDRKTRKPNEKQERNEENAGKPTEAQGKPMKKSEKVKTVQENQWKNTGNQWKTREAKENRENKEGRGNQGKWKENLSKPKPKKDACQGRQGRPGFRSVGDRDSPNATKQIPKTIFYRSPVDACSANVNSTTGTSCASSIVMAPLSISTISLVLFIASNHTTHNAYCIQWYLALVALLHLTEYLWKNPCWKRTKEVNLKPWACIILYHWIVLHDCMIENTFFFLKGETSLVDYFKTCRLA